MNLKQILFKFIFGTYRRIYYCIFSMIHPPMPKPDDEMKIDVVIPIIEKDLDILPLCIEGVRHCVPHKIDKIYLVGPRKEAIVGFAKEHKTQFVDENTILGYSPKNLNLKIKGYDRSGWLFQQLIKLSGQIGENQYCLVIDSDHILIRPHTFIDKEGRHVLYVSKEYNYPYYANFKKLFSFFPYQQASYIAHKMIFNRTLLAGLRQELEKRNPKKGEWDKIIITGTDKQCISFFSEYETYGHWVPQSEKIRLPWKQKHLHKRQDIPTYDYLCKKYSSTYWSLTFPDYLKR